MLLAANEGGEVWKLTGTWKSNIDDLGNRDSAWESGATGTTTELVLTLSTKSEELRAKAEKAEKGEGSAEGFLMGQHPNDCKPDRPVSAVLVKCRQQHSSAN